MSSIDRIKSSGRVETNGPELHHIGFVVPSIQSAVEYFGQFIAASWDKQIIHDPLQSVCVAFLRPYSPTNPLIELVEPAGGGSPVSKFLERGGGLHHMCYQVDRLEAQLELCRSWGALMVKPPLPAVAFGGRQTAWIYTTSRLLLEYLER